MFMLFEFMFLIIFVMVFGMIIFQFVTGIGTWHKNNQSPRLSVSATIVAKRENITHHSHANAGDLSGTHGYHSTSSTSYYVTFQVESGDRMELPVSGREYGMLAEGDIGKLSFQGTRETMRKSLQIRFFYFCQYHPTHLHCAFSQDIRQYFLPEAFLNAEISRLLQ